MIKGTSIEFLEDVLNNGVRSKEFYSVGVLDSDSTPLDADFSQLSKSNIDKINYKDIINSTYSEKKYGKTYYIIKEDDFDKDKSYGDDYKYTRYIRTGIGSNKISGIVTSEWSDEYSYIIAMHGNYIPVVDKESGNLLFSKEKYKSIRDSMKGLSFYQGEDFEIDEDACNNIVLSEAETLKKEAEGKISTEEKREKIIEKIKRILPKPVFSQMIGDISSKNIEFVDTGSTGRGTNIPGDGDFDFVMKCFNDDEMKQMTSLLISSINGIDKGGTNDYNIRYTDVEIPGLAEKIDLDVTSEKKSLKNTYSSDMCIRDRLDNIRKIYGDEKCQNVIDNIIVTKKRLKEAGLYKKSGTKDATKFGGFGGIGVENWILQNGGSYIHAMETFLDNSYDENGNEIDFNTFMSKYPIYDFGENHRERLDKHDHYINGLSYEGFTQIKKLFKENLLEYGIKYEYRKEGHALKKIEPEKREISINGMDDFSREEQTISFGDITRIYGYMAILNNYVEDKSKKDNVDSLDYANIDKNLMQTYFDLGVQRQDINQQYSDVKRDNKVHDNNRINENDNYHDGNDDGFDI